MFDNAKYKEERRAQNIDDQLSVRTYNIIIGATLLFGFLINYLIAMYCKEFVLGLNPLIVLIGYIVISLVCMFVIHISHNPVVSFIFYTVLTVVMGILLTFFVSNYTKSTIERAFLVTMLITVIMIVLSVAKPEFFLGLWKVLAISLIICVVSELIIAFVFRQNLTIFDWIIAIIFCGYIGYDWSMSQEYPKTVDNAIDSAADLYIDIVNLFIRILSIMGRRKD